MKSQTKKGTWKPFKKNPSFLTILIIPKHTPAGVWAGIKKL